MNKNRRKIAAVISLCLLVAMLAGCSGGKVSLTKKEPQEGATVYTLEGKCTAEAADGKVTVYLHSNLLEGTAVRFCLDTYDGEQLASEVYTVSGATIQTSFPIEADWEGKLVYASVVAAPSIGGQPKEVTEAYGRYFQNIDGSCVIWNKSENIFLAQSAKIEL